MHFQRGMIDLWFHEFHSLLLAYHQSDPVGNEAHHSILYASNHQCTVTYYLVYSRCYTHRLAVTSCNSLCVLLLKNISWIKIFTICILTVCMASSFPWVFSWVNVCCHWLHTIQPHLRLPCSVKDPYNFCLPNYYSLLLYTYILVMLLILFKQKTTLLRYFWN